MRALIAGLGSIGRRHLANLRELAPAASIVVWHQQTSTPGHTAGLADREVFSLESALETMPDVALVTGPASTHVVTATALAGAGAHLLVEKPLSDSLSGVDALLHRCVANGLTLLVGYNLRFAPDLQAIKQALDDGRIGRVLSVRAEVGSYLPDWRPSADYRTTVSARRDLGGGVLGELSHEIDYVQWLVGDIIEVSARVGQLSPLEIDVEDIAELVVTFASGALGSIHLDMLQRAPTRTCRIIGVDGTIIWDGLSGHVALFSSDTGDWTELSAAGSARIADTYVAELRHFLDCVHGRSTPLTTGTDARRVLQVVLAAKQASAERRAVVL